MSIMMCEHCEEFYDSDYDEGFQMNDGKIVCENCTEYYDEDDNLIASDDQLGLYGLPHQ